jgi:hypothetical protein
LEPLRSPDFFNRKKPVKKFETVSKKTWKGFSKMSEKFS